MRKYLVDDRDNYDNEHKCDGDFPPQVIERSSSPQAIDEVVVRVARVKKAQHKKGQKKEQHRKGQKILRENP